MDQKPFFRAINSEFDKGEAVVLQKLSSGDMRSGLLRTPTRNHLLGSYWASQGVIGRRNNDMSCWDEDCLSAA